MSIEFLKALKEADKVAFIKSLLPSGGVGGSPFDPSVAMIEKGVITNMTDIIETGIYNGKNVKDSPVTGDILVMASQDPHGNMGYFVMDSQMDLYMGGKKAGTSTFAWNRVLNEGAKTITNITDIKSTGAYEGLDVVGAPVQGKIIIQALQDITGDISYTVYSSDGHLRLGGKPAHGHIQWNPVIPLIFTGPKFPSKNIGIDGDGYIQTGTVQTAADVGKPTFKAGEKHNTLDLNVPANVVSVSFGMVNKVVVVPVHGQAGKFDIHLYAGMGGKNPIHGAPAKQPFPSMIMFINNIEISVSDMDMTSMAQGYITIDHKHPQAELIATSLEVANTGNVTIQYANHGATTFEKIAGAWFKGITAPDVIGMIGAMMPTVNMNLQSMQPVYNPKARAYAKGALVAEGGKFYVANKKMGKMGAEIGAFKPADWDEFDKHFKYAPTMPTADGKYVATVKAGVTTWEVEALDRPTVVSAYTATPTAAELIAAAKLLPHYANTVAFWGADHDFYVRDDPQTKMLLVKYRGVATNTDETKAGNFFFEKLALAK